MRLIGRYLEWILCSDIVLCVSDALKCDCRVWNVSFFVCIACGAMRLLNTGQLGSRVLVKLEA